MQQAVCEKLDCRKKFIPLRVQGYEYTANESGSDE
jgi:hypothetical protein